MKILLDENFPLARVGKLRDEGQEVDHIILLGLRGTHDSAIVQRLNSEELLFVTCDQEFFDLPVTHSVIMISRVAQSLPLPIRLDAWLNAIREYFSHPGSENCSKSSTTGSCIHVRSCLPITEQIN